MAIHTKEVGVFKTSALSGNVGVADVGDNKGKTYIVDLDKIDALTIIGRNRVDDDTIADFDEVLKVGQDGKRFQNKELGLIDNETGAVDAELIELIRVAALDGEDGGSYTINLVDIGNGFVEVAVDGKAADADIFRFEGDQLNSVVAQLSDIEAVCDALPTMLDLKNNASQVAVFDYETAKDSFFHGSDADVDSAAVKAILGGSRLDASEAAELVAYALSDAGQADEHITIDFNGSGIILNIDASRDTTDTIILKGNILLDELTTSTHEGKPIVDLKNSASQTAVFDFDEENSFFHGSISDVDSATVREILGGSRLDAFEAAELVAYALSAEGLSDQNIAYLGGDADSAIIAINGSQDSTDTLFITGSEFNFL